MTLFREQAGDDEPAVLFHDAASFRATAMPWPGFEATPALRGRWCHEIEHAVDKIKLGLGDSGQRSRDQIDRWMRHLWYKAAVLRGRSQAASRRPVVSVELEAQRNRVVDLGNQLLRQVQGDLPAATVTALRKHTASQK